MSNYNPFVWREVQSAKLEKIDSKFRTIIRPIVEVSLRSPKSEWKREFPILDSGASISVFTKSVADRLQLDLKSGKPTDLSTMSTTSLKIWVHKVDIKIGESILRDVHVGFSELEKHYPVIGIIDFFEAFQISMRAKVRDGNLIRET